MSSSLSGGGSAIAIAKFLVHSVVFMTLGAVLSYSFLENDITRLLPLLSTNESTQSSIIPSLSVEHQQQLLDKTKQADHIRYLPSERILAVVTAKGGSTSFWKWMYTSVTGKEEFNCSTYVQNVRANCWNGRAVALPDLSEDDRLFALTDPSVLRVAVWRDPFDRIISCWKSKFACDAWIYGTDYPDRARMVPQLRNVAGFKDKTPLECLNISQFANTLDKTRLRIQSGQVSVDELNPHIKPQQFFFSLVNYSLILDISQLSNASAVRSITDRLPFATNDSAIEHLHASEGTELTIPESAAALIAKFSALTEPIPQPLSMDSRQS